MERLLRSALRPPPGAADECPDPGRLAAFVEGALTANEEAALDGHIAACGRCQEALAVLAHALPDEGVEALEQPRQSGWFTWATRPRLRWLVPISAAATVAVVIFATRPLIAPEGVTPVAEFARAAEAPAPPVEAPEPAKQAVTTMADVAPAAEQKRDKREAVPDPAEPAVLAPATPQASRMAAAQEAAAPTAARLAAAPPAANAAVAADTVAKGAVAGTRAMAAQTTEAAAVNVAAPGGTVRWRAGAGGQIARSDDGGATWRAQASGVTANLFAGAAPSPMTCWVVGAAGTVLLTTDGERWERRPFPLAIDLTAVEASSARAATVNARDGRRFETMDAGLTWTPKQ
jgi:hypothetical protein